MFELKNAFYKRFLSKEIKIWFELPGFELTDFDCIEENNVKRNRINIHFN